MFVKFNPAIEDSCTIDQQRTLEILDIGTNIYTSWQEIEDNCIGGDVCSEIRDNEETPAAEMVDKVGIV
jgi:hypothetical protein